jgi:hypothetical protein
MNWREFIKDTETIQVPRIKASKLRLNSEKAVQKRSSSTLLAMLK